MPPDGSKIVSGLAVRAVSSLRKPVAGSLVCVLAKHFSRAGVAFGTLLSKGLCPASKRSMADSKYFAGAD